jgi:hypothetical protein
VPSVLKLSPTFAILLLEGDCAAPMPGEAVQSTAAALIEDIRARLTALAEGAPRIYGPGAGARTVLRILTTAPDEGEGSVAAVASGLGLPLHRVCASASAVHDHSGDERAVIVGADPATAAVTDGVSLRQEVALAFSDMVVVSWDGSTLGEHTLLIREAAVCGKAIVWIDASGEARLLDGSRLTEVATHLLRAGHPSAQMLSAMFAPMTAAALDGVLTQLAHPRQAGGHREFARSLDDYFAAEVKAPHAQPLAGRLDKSLERLLTLLSPRRAHPAAKPALLSPADESALTTLEQRKQWSSHRSRHASGAFRDTAWVLWIFSPLAVFFAAANVVKLWVGDHSIAWISSELGAMLFILALVILARRRDWHGQWLQHRFLAEQLRYAQLAYPLLTFLPAFTRSVPATPESWVLHRALVEVGVPANVDGSPFLAGARLQERRESVLRAIDGQLRYHTDKHHALEHMERRLEAFSTGAFALTAIAVAGHLFVHQSWLLLLTITLPAVAAAAHGILSSLEVKRVAWLSRTTATRLHGLQAAMKSVDLDDPAAWLWIRFLTEQAARTMSDDTEQWRELVDRHGLELPA